MHRGWSELTAEWNTLSDDARDRLRATVRAEASWARLPRRVLEVHPSNVDLTRLHQVLAEPDRLAHARLLTIRCASYHRLAEVLNDGTETVYLAEVDRVTNGFVQLDGEGLHVLPAAPARLTSRRGLHIEYLVRTTPDLPTEALKEYRLPARCACRGGACVDPPAVGRCPALQEQARVRCVGGVGIALAACTAPV